MNREILISKMFAGSYLGEGENIGHEVINLFKADNGNNYLYITPSGVINLEQHPIENVLLAKSITKKTVEIIAKADQLAPVDKDEAWRIAYADISLHKIFNENIYQGSEEFRDYIDVSFRAGRIVSPKANTRILVTIDPDFAADDDSAKLIRLDSTAKVIFGQSQRKYFSSLSDAIAFNELEKLVNDDSYWEKNTFTKKINLNNVLVNPGVSFLEIIRKENDELIFSNLLAYYFQYNQMMFRKFVKDVLKINEFKDQFIIKREHHNIDLWIEDGDQVLVIENKIKSGINGHKSDDYAQLNKYQDYAEKTAISSRKQVYYFVFIPDYNLLDLKKYNLPKPYRIIKYSEIYKFFVKYAAKYVNDKYFADFLRGLRNHTMSMAELNLSIMRSRFIERLQSVD